MPNPSTTEIELLVVTGAYAVVLVLVVYLTRAGRRRVVGALAGGLAAAVVALLATTVAELNVWWRVPVVQAASGRVVILAGLAISMTPVYLVTWRVARRFGMRGLTVCVGLAAMVGPPRDYAFAAQFPNWMVLSPGMAPVLAVAVTYVLWSALGHGVMRLVAGPADTDTLRRHEAMLPAPSSRASSHALLRSVYGVWPTRVSRSRKRSSSRTESNVGSILSQSASHPERSS